jgi:hypothetical protein
MRKEMRRKENKTLDLFKVEVRKCLSQLNNLKKKALNNLHKTLTE